MASTRAMRPDALTRSLGFWQVTVSGVGMVIGAGIYVVIGEAAKDAGSALWISFVLAAVLSALTGLSYAELAGMFPTAGAEYEFARRAFNDFTGFMAGWMMVLANIIAAAAVSIGFAHYLQHFFDVNLRAGAIGLLAVLTLIVMSGEQRSIWFSVMLAVLQVGGLLFVIASGAPHIGSRSLIEGSTASGVLAGAALVFFAFIGFDEIVTLSEETRDAERVIPRALLLALGISAALYVLVGICAVSLIGADALAASDRPLALVIGHDWGGRASGIVTFIALASTTNTNIARADGGVSTDLQHVAARRLAARTLQRQYTRARAAHRGSAGVRPRGRDRAQRQHRARSVGHRLRRLCDLHRREPVADCPALSSA
jgi:basic amino acid/polyamine antiporter, APA family